MTDAIHAERRHPDQPDQPVSPAALGDGLLEQARGLDAGRSARTLTPGAGATLKQTILALVEGSRLDEHQAPGPATILVLRGDMRMGTSDGTVELSEGQWAAIPDEVHDLEAVTDAVALLTVAPRGA